MGDWRWDIRTDQDGGGGMWKEAMGVLGGDAELVVDWKLYS